VDTDRFDRLSRAISSLLTRRNLAGVLGLGIVALPGLIDARKKRKHKKKVKKNKFGCVDGANVPCTSADGLDGTCFTRTGKSAFCLTNAHCVPCQKDADCVPLCGETAACVVCEAFCPSTGTFCAGSSAVNCIFAP
jgi:hypothetical protein